MVDKMGDQVSPVRWENIFFPYMWRQKVRLAYVIISLSTFFFFGFNLGSKLTATFTGLYFGQG